MTYFWKTVVHKQYVVAIRVVGFFFILLAVFLSHPVSSASAKQKEKKIQIGIAPWVNNEEYNKNITAFKKRLALVGFVEGQNTIYYQENAQGDPQKQIKIIQSFVDKKVDLIYSLTTPGTLITKSIAKDIPIVFSVVLFPVETGIIKSFMSSENNCVGTRNYISEGKQLETLFTIFHQVRKMGFIHLKEDPDSTIQLGRMKDMGKNFDLEVIDMPVSSLNELKNFSNETVDAFYLACDTFIQTEGEDSIIDMAHNRKIPTLSCSRSGILKGALVGDVVDLTNLGTVAGKKAAAILTGQSPTELITETQQGSYVVVNLKTAASLGLSVPDKLLAISSEIIQ